LPAGVNENGIRSAVFRARAARTQAEQEQIQRQIDATDRQIDTLVYELYGRTPDEIAVVQGAG